MKQCPTCSAYVIGARHTCPPAWHVIPADYDAGEEPSTEYSETASGAAEPHLERHFSAYDYPGYMRRTGGYSSRWRGWRPACGASGRC